MLELTSTSPEETVKIGQILSQCLLPGDLVNLNGTLGAGKTLLVKGIGQGLGIDPGAVTSPTFPLSMSMREQSSLSIILTCTAWKVILT